MLKKTRAEIIEDFRNQVKQGKILVGVGAGTGITAKCSEKADVDMLIIYNSGRFRMAGRGSLSGLLSYGDANAIVTEMGQEVLPIVKKTPVLAGVCGTDPFRVMEIFLKQLKEQGFNGVQNFPTVGLIDGKFRANLEETGMMETEYDLLASAMDALEAGHDANTVICLYLADLLKLFGSEPDVDECTVCGKKMVRSISVKAGGFLCEEHAVQEKAPFLPKEDLKRFRLLCKAGMAHLDIAEKADPAKLPDVSFLAEFIHAYTGSSIASIAFYEEVSAL